MIGRLALMAFAAAMIGMQPWLATQAQDVPGIEICTVEKNMERRTSCLQSNIDFLQKSITKSNSEHQQRLEAANRQIEALKAAVNSLQKGLDELQTAQKKSAADLARKADTVAKDPSAKGTQKGTQKPAESPAEKANEGTK